MKFRFADVGEGIQEGEIVRWHVEEGERVQRDQILVEVETDKAIVDLPSPCGGVVERLGGSPGDVVNVGDVLVVIDEDGDPTPSEDDGPGETSSGTVVGRIDEGDDLLEDGEEADESGGPGTVLATPATRNLARQLEVDLHEVEGTGKRGRITKEDVRRAAGQGEEPVDEPGPVEVEDLRGVRRAIARRVTRNHRSIPQVTQMDRADVTDLAEILASDPEVPSGFLPYFVKAAARSLVEIPRMNARYSAEDEQIIHRKYYHLGISVDTEEGLMVPVLRDADQRSLREIEERVRELAERCRNRTVNREELEGATFTITNVGSVGGTWSTPQVNAPQVGILATGRVREVPVVREGDVEVGRELPVSLSFDHRVLDGADAARFTNRFIERLENPGRFDW